MLGTSQKWVTKNAKTHMLVRYLRPAREKDRNLTSV
jgi:hypothetical protein